ncbi:transcriptional regulator, AsnC family [Ferrithrix thermotolerans DSM 19514]|uniref:Transcriptional regulator, AsnC family n=1 Tax=Ferrithrix thermotolerans DSM 19514 TaxID=1121881 RepID=A0A1M4S5K5_9ACTN|nr:Lrp/AsnC ligand binding domain-containing protein [Ferrithrix thermotolerans]SHE27297.1 transcriptional regulator, AsnC family [Ferrithrix thermotolerans DSM 19514]
MQAYVLIQTDLGRVTDILRKVKEIATVTRADSVTGPYDIIALLEAPSVEEIGREVVESIQVIDGVTRTLTCPIGNLDQLH